MNRPPHGGVFQVSPMEGIAFETPFSLSCSGWSDEIEDLPLSYGFRYKAGDAEEVWYIYTTQPL